LIQEQKNVLRDGHEITSATGVGFLFIFKACPVLYAACLGTIDNKSNFKFKDVKFEVSFLSNAGNLIDASPVKDQNLTIMSNNTTNFRVRAVAQMKREFYNNCTVKITDAWAI
jgi:hypothetical protein